MDDRAWERRHDTLDGSRNVSHNDTGNPDAGEEFTMSKTQDGGSGSPDCSHVCSKEVSDDGWHFQKCGRPAKAVMHWGDHDTYLCGIHAKRWARDDRLELIK